MNIDLITLGFSIRDTIEFRNGDFVYLAKYFVKPEVIYLSNISIPHEENAKLIESDQFKKDDFFALNSSSSIEELDSILARLILKNNNSYPDLFIVNDMPLGYLLWNKGKLYTCYFSDEFIEILKKYY
jgi:hypothetical protein